MALSHEDVRVGFGDDGWLFLPSSYEPMCEDIDVASVANRMRRLTEASAEVGKPVVLLIIPDKGAVYPDKLGPLEAAFECAETRRAELRAELAADPPAGFIDAWAALRELRAASGEKLYPPQDSHWTTFTAINIAELIVGEFEDGVWDASSVRQVGFEIPDGDLANRIGLQLLEAVRVYDVEREGVSVSELQWGSRAINKYATEAGDDAFLLPGRLLVLHDSYGNKLKDPLANYVEEAWFVHWRLLKQGVISTDQLAEIAGDSDYVVIESAERLIYERLLVDCPRLHEVFRNRLVGTPAS